MRPRTPRGGPDRLPCRAVDDRDGCRRILPAHVTGERPTDGKHGKRLGIVRVDGDRLLEQALRLEIVLAGDAPEVRQRAHDQTPSVEVLGRLALGVEVLRGIHLRLDCRHDGLGDLVLYGKYVGQAAVVALGPKLAAGRDVVQLRGNTHALAAFAHAAFDQIADSEFLADLLHGRRLTLVR